MELRTPRLNIVLQDREEVERMIAAMPESDRAQVSPHWLAQLRASTEPDPWVLAFSAVLRETGEVVGNCSFKGPPVDGTVEIAYGISPDHQNRGYATEAARALTEFAASRPDVRLIRAHTLPNGVASQRVLVKCGFKHVGEVIDPEDGTVARFERATDTRA